MGMKFKNINIQGAELSEIQQLYPKDEVMQFVPGWITLTSDAFDWGGVHDIAKRLSKKLPYAILSTEYFDDSYAEFFVFRNGKRVARHVPNEYDGFPRRPGSCKEWIEALDLTPDAAPCLRLIFQEQNPEICLHLLAGLLNCVLWVEYQYAEHAEMPDPQYLEDYAARKKAEKKIKNKTKLTLVEEVPGFFWWEDYPLSRRGSDYPDGTCWIVQNGRMQEMDLKQHPHLVKGIYLDQKHLFHDGQCTDSETNQILWTLRSEDVMYWIPAPVSFPDNRFATALYFRRDRDRYSRLVSFFADGSEMIIRDFPEAHTNLAVDGQNLYYAVEKCLICCDSMLRELWRMDLGFQTYDSGKLFYDEQTQMLYYASYFNAAAIDPRTKKITAFRSIAEHEDYYCQAFFPGVGLIMRAGDSSFQVWDRTLQMISRHRAKGFLHSFIQADGEYYVLTNTDADENAKLRLYKLTITGK